MTVSRKFKDHVATFPVLSHVRSLKQSGVIPPYKRAVIFLSAIQHIGTPRLIILLSFVDFSAIAHKSLLEFTQSLCSHG